MKLPLFRRLLIVITVATAALVGSGCSSNPTIAPNWYDSSFYKDGAVKGSDNLGTAATAEPGNR